MFRRDIIYDVHKRMMHFDIHVDDMDTVHRMGRTVICPSFPHSCLLSLRAKRSNLSAFWDCHRISNRILHKDTSIVIASEAKQSLCLSFEEIATNNPTQNLSLQKVVEKRKPCFGFAKNFLKTGGESGIRTQGMQGIQRFFRLGGLTEVSET